MIDIVPNFNCDMLNFIRGDFGPFHSNLATEVPLWLALALKERQKCRIEPPAWMSADALKMVLDEERGEEGIGKRLPFHYIEIAHSLFNHAADNIPDADRVRTLLEDLQNIRMSKLRQGATDVFGEAREGPIDGAKLTGVAHMELNTIRRMCVTVVVAGLGDPPVPALPVLTVLHFIFFDLRVLLHPHRHVHTHTHACTQFCFRARPGLELAGKK